MLPIRGVQAESLNNWDNKLSSVIFTQGCNLNCEYCYNQELREIITIPSDNESIIHKLKNNYLNINNVVITGGEPTIHGDSLIDFITKLKEMNFNVKLDTNGTIPFVLKELINKNLIDYIAMDIKVVPWKYFTACGKNCILDIPESIKLIKKSGINHEFRSVIYNGGEFTIFDILEITKLVGKSDYILQQYKGDKFRPYSDVQINSLKSKYPKIKFRLG